MSTYGHIDKVAPSAGGQGISSKSYSFTSRGLGSGVFYSAGFYRAAANDANLSQASSTVSLGTGNVSFAAHAFIVAGGPGAAAGGVGQVEIEVSGTSITDAGVRTPGDSEVIVADITTLVLNQFAETSKKWIGQITYTIQNAPGGTHTTFNADFNYGWNKYEDFGNQDFIVRAFECVGLGGATDTDFNIRLLKQDSNNWTYAATGFVPGGTELLNMGTIHGAEDNIVNNAPFAFKLAGLAFPVNGNDSEGVIVEITSGANTVQIMDIHIGVEIS